MKHLMLAAVASLGLISAAAAQTSMGTTTTTTGTMGTTATTGSTTSTVVIQPEMRTRMRQYVTTNRAQAVEVPSGFTVRQGAMLPSTVRVQSFPAEMGMMQYRYVMMGNQTLLVDANGMIVDIMD